MIKRWGHSGLGCQPISLYSTYCPGTTSSVHSFPILRTCTVAWWDPWPSAEKASWSPTEDGVTWTENLPCYSWFLMKTSLGIWRRMWKLMGPRIQAVLTCRMRLSWRAIKCMVCRKKRILFPKKFLLVSWRYFWEAYHNLREHNLWKVRKVEWGHIRRNV